MTINYRFSTRNAKAIADCRKVDMKTKIEDFWDKLEAVLHCIAIVFVLGVMIYLGGC